MPVQVATPEAFRLFQEGQIALAQVERNGMRIDVDYLQRTSREVQKQITDLKHELRSDVFYKHYRKQFGMKANLGSLPQLGEIVFGTLKYPSVGETKTGRFRTDEEAFEYVDIPFVKKLRRLRKLEKVQSTYLKNLIQEVVDGYIHPIFNLNTARTYRSSCDHPNAQNVPNRDEFLARYTRTSFIPRRGRRLVELDFKGAEVGTAACVVGDTKIETIDGPQTISDVCQKVSKGEEVFVYGYCKSKERISVSKVLEGGITGKRVEVWKITLDNGESVTATPDHKFMMRDGRYIPLKDLSVGDSLMPFYKRNKKSRWGTVYTQLYLNNGQKMMAHNLIALDLFGVNIGESGQVVHHWNGKGTDNRLSNIEIMNRSRHMSIHIKQSWKNLKKGHKRYDWRKTEEFRSRMRELNRKRKEEWTDSDWEEFGKRVSEGIKRTGGSKGERNAMFGKKHSIETKQKISLSKKGKKRAGPNWNKGLTKFDHPSLMSISRKAKKRPPPNKGKKMPPLSNEHKRKLSEAMKGREFSKSTRRKLSVNKSRYWAELRSKEPNKQCPICKVMFRSLAAHMTKTHNITPREFRETFNHKVVAIEPAGREDVYNITVKGIHNYAVSSGVVIKNCYTEDRVLIKYIKDPKSNMHTDTAIKLFLIEDWQVDKKTTRDAAKNRFVFPSFYGSTYFNCAPNLWKGVIDDNFCVLNKDGSKGITIREHLKSHGIAELGDCTPSHAPKKGTYEYLVKKVEEDFWQRRFRDYTEWKNRSWREYQRKGELLTFTGFRVAGDMERNQVLNYPIQGSAFHCLLWSLIRLQKWLNKRRMKTLIICQIHDSVILDVVPEEQDEVLAKLKQIITVDLPKFWDWIIVPLSVEAEASEIDGNWFEKKGIEI